MLTLSHNGQAHCYTVAPGKCNHLLKPTASRYTSELYIQCGPITCTQGNQMIVWGEGCGGGWGGLWDGGWGVG